MRVHHSKQHRPYPSHAPPAPSSFITPVRHWGLLPTTQGPTRLYQACAKSAPRGGSGLAQRRPEGALSVPLIGCGGRLMRLGGCRLPQSSAATDCSLSKVSRPGVAVSVSLSHPRTRTRRPGVYHACALLAIHGIVAIYVSHVQIHRKSTVNPWLKVRLPSQLLSFHCSSSSLPGMSSLLRCLISFYHLIYRRALVYLAVAIWSPFPALYPFPALGIQRRCSTAAHPLLPTAADQPLQHPPTIHSAPPIPPSKHPSKLALCSHPASAIPYRLCYLPYPYHTYPYHTCPHETLSP